MSKKYTLPEDTAPKMAGEPAVAEMATLSRHSALRYRAYEEFESSYDMPDAPCQYSIDEVKSILDQNRQNFKNGKFTSMEVVDRIMDSWG